MRYVPHWSVFALVLLVLTTFGGSQAAEFEVGFATVDITPPVGWRRAGGYGEMISTGVRDPLQAKAMAFSQGDVEVVLVGNDLCSVPRALTDRARSRAGERIGIPPANIIITATHTHGGPEYHGPLRDVFSARAAEENGGRDPREPIDYQALLVERWVEVIAEAHANRRGAALSVVVPLQPGLAFNRRFLMKDGSTGWIPGKLNPEIVRPLGPTDPELPFVLARDAETGRPLGGLTVFAMHTAIYGDPPFGADYPGHLQAHLRRQLGEGEFVSLFAQGCAGDVNHIDVNTSDPQDGETYPPYVGARLAATIARALPLSRPIAGDQLAIRSATVAAPILPISEAEYEQSRRILEEPDDGGRPFLERVAAWRTMLGHRFREEHGDRLPQEVQVIRLDEDTAVVALPHEVFVELGMAIKSASPFRTTIVISLANDMDFYIPTRRAFEEGHYEPTTCPLEPGCGERLVATAVELLQGLKP
ncbi:hypothetical protein [Tautonia rosea]|uniref:hypothetical protein n=1 Tax=Tautonia rosea TaxID=2728037 RepID=UPI001472D64B|nr:hypothetical protein [Tautonia rosea]